MANLLIVNLINLKMIFSKFLESIQVKLVLMELLFLIFSDAWISIITFKSVILKDKIMRSLEFILKDFLTGFLRKVLNIPLIFKKDLLQNPKIWSNKLKVWIPYFLFSKAKTSTKTLQILLDKEISISTTTQLKMNTK